jgi:hypothetical protein
MADDMTDARADTPSFGKGFRRPGYDMLGTTRWKTYDTQAMEKT